MRRGSFSQYVAYLFVRVAVGGLRLLPASWALVGARGLAWVGWWLDRRHRRVAIENVRLVYGDDLEESESRRLARAGFTHLLLVTVEFALLGRLFARGQAERCLTVHHQDVLEQAAAGGKGIIFVCGHAGNWEVIGALMTRLGYPLNIVSRPIENPYLQDWARRYRISFGETLVPKDGAIRSVARLLRQGKHVVFMMDQHAGRHGLQVEFLGHPCSTFASAAAMARTFDVAIVTGHAARSARPMAFEAELALVARPDRTLDKDEDILRMTRAINEAIGAFILEHPDQWLWLHRRWRGAKRAAPFAEVTSSTTETV